MSATLKDIADQAGVSIATVSHVINQTRFVSPDLVQRVMAAIEGSDYREKLQKKSKTLRTGKSSGVAFIAPHLLSPVFAQLASALSARLGEAGYTLSVYETRDDREREEHILRELAANKRIIGAVVTPSGESPAEYDAYVNHGMHLVLLDRIVEGARADCILAENEQALYLGTMHLARSGHQRILLLLENHRMSTTQERLAGYRRALAEQHVPYDENLVLRLDLSSDQECAKAMRKAFVAKTFTAIIAGGNRLTLAAIQELERMGYDCPKDVSVVGFGDEPWCEFTSPPLTTLKQDTEAMSRTAAERLLARIQGDASEPQKIRVPVSLTIRKSTQMIGQGPFGEKAVSPDEIVLTKDEIVRLKRSGFKVALSFHYTGTNWARLHENGIRTTLEKYGIRLVTVTDAHFDPNLQVTQLDGIRLQDPDAIIAVPSDDRVTAQKFRQVSDRAKLIFISNVPEGFGKEEYACCVSVNERENGHNAGVLLGEQFVGRNRVCVGFINHGTPFYGTRLRDMAAEQTIVESYPNIEIVRIDNFYSISNAYEISKRMLIENPEIEGLYISWDRPALESIRALKELGREDVAIITFDLDLEIATYMAKGQMVRGLSTQHPYEQGVAAAMATAKALLGNAEYKYIAVPPSVVQPQNLLRAWREIVHEREPESLRQLLNE